MGISDGTAACVLDCATSGDAKDALSLSDAAGWNQTAEDWAVFTRHGRVRGRRRSDSGELVATAATLPYGAAQGWISMVLVRADWSGRGLATELLGECIRDLRSAGIAPLLDATPAGEPVYRRLGFECGLRFERWEASPTRRTTTAGCTCRLAGEADWPRIVALDADASRVERTFLLRAFLSRPASRAFITTDGTGFVLVRAGRRATQIGPLVACDPASAIALLDAALATIDGPVFLDVPSEQAAAVNHLKSLGFESQRPFVRMALGEAAALRGSEGQFALAGPEFG